MNMTFFAVIFLSCGELGTKTNLINRNSKKMCILSFNIRCFCICNKFNVLFIWFEISQSNESRHFKFGSSYLWSKTSGHMFSCDFTNSQIIVHIRNLKFVTISVSWYSYIDPKWSWEFFFWYHTQIKVKDLLKKNKYFFKNDQLHFQDLINIHSLFF